MKRKYNYEQLLDRMSIDFSFLRRDQRDGYTFSQSEASAGNYYPLVTGIIIKDEKEGLQLSVVTDRAQGGGSIRDGQIEIMVSSELRKLVYSSLMSRFIDVLLLMTVWVFLRYEMVAKILDKFIF